jgi:capsular polysaccharide transport system permease protein
VLTIELQAFDPAYGQRVVALMLQESDRFINKLGHQVALEQLAFVEKEVDRAYQRVQTEKAKVSISRIAITLSARNRPAVPVLV